MLAPRLRDAMNAHDLEGLLAHFHEDYDSEQPVHPGRGFAGRDQVRSNWSAIFSSMPDFHAELRGHCVGDGEEWCEWHWTGTRADGRTIEIAGVMILGVRDDRITWGRLYLEPVEATGEDIDTTMRRMAGRRPAE